MTMLLWLILIFIMGGLLFYLWDDWRDTHNTLSWWERDAQERERLQASLDAKDDE